MNLLHIQEQFPTRHACLAHIEAVRWKTNVICPYCTSERVTPIASERRHHCNACNTTFSVTVNTVFHHTHLPLQKWFLALSLFLNTRKAITVRQLARDLETNKNTACYVGSRIRRALADPASRRLLNDITQTATGPPTARPRPGGRLFASGPPHGE